METLQQRIRKLRGSKTQQEFAQELGVPLNTLGRYERGENNPDILFLRDLSRKFAVSLDWLVFGEDAPAVRHTGDTHRGGGGSCPLCSELLGRLTAEHERLFLAHERECALLREIAILRERSGGTKTDGAEEA